jgi:hypothetical protein
MNHVTSWKIAIMREYLHNSHGNRLLGKPQRKKSKQVAVQRREDSNGCGLVDGVMSSTSGTWTAGA